MAALALAVGALLVTGGSVAEPAGAAGNPIQTENALAGTTSWGPPQQGLTAQNQHALEGYASEISVQPGDTIHLHVSTSPAARYRIQMYRLGWYGGSGGRLLGCIPSCGGDEQGTAYSVPSLDGNGYVDAGLADHRHVHDPEQRRFGLLPREARARRTARSPAAHTTSR